MDWLVVPWFVGFVGVKPMDVQRIGPAAVQFHSVMGLLFVSLALFWTVDYMRKGLASRPGPKLPAIARRVHPLLHKVLIWGVFCVALTGFGLGLTSAVLLWAGGIVPIAPPLNMPRANDFVGVVHEVQFYTLAVIAGFHVVFHLWRHYRLRDNALRIMAPKSVHRFL